MPEPHPKVLTTRWTPLSVGGAAGYCGCVKGQALPTTFLPAPVAQGPMSKGWPDVTMRISAWLWNKENNGEDNRDTPQLPSAAAETPRSWVAKIPTP